MKKILDLEVQDFPDVDPGKFQAWKDAQVNNLKKNNIAGMIMFAGLLILLLFRDQFLPAMIFGVSMVIGIIIIVPPYRKVRMAQKEAGLTRTEILKARKK